MTGPALATKAVSFQCVPSPVREETSFESIARQPCQVVYSGSDRATTASPRLSIDGLLERQSESMRDLEVNKIECIQKDSELFSPKRLAKEKPSVWREKRTRDELVWIAAASGNILQLQEALAEPEDGSTPANIDFRGLGERTPLHCAVGVGSEECTRCILEARADIGARTENGLTPLHTACREGRSAAAALLLEFRADALAETNDQSLAAHIAASAGHQNVLAMLLKHAGQEQLRRRNSLGQRPVDVASCLNVHEELVAALREHEEAAVPQDTYTGRVPHRASGVLLHNSRADVVSRILFRMHRGTGRDVVAPCPDAPGRGARVLAEPRPRTSERAFTRVRADSAVEEARLDSFKPVQKLGAGTFGVVYKVVHKSTECVYAMKMLDKTKIMTSGSLMRYTQTERNVLSYVKHPYIVQLHYAFQTPTHLILVLQFCSRGNLQSLLKRHNKLPVQLANLYGAEVLLAICYLHERDTVYRDMKPENVVLDQDGHAMLTDFGLSKEGVHGLEAAKSFCGSWAFMAPEIIRRKGHGKTVDTYGIGVMTYCMLVGTPPFYNRHKETLLDNIKHMPLKVPSSVPEAAADFVQATMRKHPKDRLGAGQTEELKGHVWFGDVSWTALMNRDVAVPEGIFDKQVRSNFTAAEPSVGAEAVYGQLQRHARSRSGSQHVPNWEFASPGEDALKRDRTL